MTSEFPSVKAKEKIEIAVATDTVLYLPFYVAYYNNDFSNTPFSALEVVIIGTNNDFRFVSGRKLKGDGYATFAVLLGLADAAICDPSFLVYLSKCDNTELDRELRIFQEFLTPDTKQQICSKNYDEELHQCLYVKDSVLEIKQIDQFKKIIVRSTQVIGGMVSKIAFVAVGSENMISKTSLSETLGGCYLDGHLPTKAGLELIKNGFYYYHSPSTGYFVGDLYYQKYYKDNKAIKSTQVDFGEELGNFVKTFMTKIIILCLILHIMRTAYPSRAILLVLTTY